MAQDHVPVKGVEVRVLSAAPTQPRETTISRGSLLSLGAFCPPWSRSLPAISTVSSGDFQLTERSCWTGTRIDRSYANAHAHMGGFRVFFVDRQGLLPAIQRIGREKPMTPPRDRCV